LSKHQNTFHNSNFWKSMQHNMDRWSDLCWYLFRCNPMLLMSYMKCWKFLFTFHIHEGKLLESTCLHYLGQTPAGCGPGEWKSCAAGPSALVHTRTCRRSRFSQSSICGFMNEQLLPVFT
jgi:hypothetical protein